MNGSACLHRSLTSVYVALKICEFIMRLLGRPLRRRMTICLLSVCLSLPLSPFFLSADFSFSRSRSCGMPLCPPAQAAPEALGRLASPTSNMCSHTAEDAPPPPELTAIASNLTNATSKTPSQGGAGASNSNRSGRGSSTPSIFALGATSPSFASRGTASADIHAGRHAGSPACIHTNVRFTS
jgi:hypothetical protein